jgi:hypothetical protein
MIDEGCSDLKKAESLGDTDAKEYIKEICPWT